jgi:hypothetical protein
MNDMLERRPSFIGFLRRAKLTHEQYNRTRAALHRARRKSRLLGRPDREGARAAIARFCALVAQTSLAAALVRINVGVP